MAFRVACGSRERGGWEMTATEFWSLTLREFVWLVEARKAVRWYGTGPAAMSEDEVDELVREKHERIARERLELHG